MRKLVVSLCAAGSAASAAAWSPRDLKSAVRVAWELPIAWRGSPPAAETPKAIPGENVSEGRGRGVVQMLSGAVLLFILGERLAWAAIYADRDLYFPDGEEDDDVEPDEDDEEDDEDEDDEAILNAFVDFLDANRHMFPRSYELAPSCNWVPSSDVPLSEIDSDSDSDSDADY